MPLETLETVFPVKLPLPIELQRIAYCESGNRHFTGKDGVVTSPTKDYGRFQINAIHIPAAKKMGLDIMKEADNEAFALYLYNENGVRDWSASYNPKTEKCTNGIKLPSELN